MRSGVAALIAGALLITGANAAEIKVLSTQATEQSYRELIPAFEKQTGHKVITIFTGTLDADKRLASGESYDMIIMSSPSIDQHLADGKLVPGSRVDLAKSGVAVAVQKGAKKPDIGSAAAVKAMLLNAKSVGYSTGPSGMIVMRLFDKMGVLDQVKPKLKQTPTAIFVGSIIASGEVEVGFQQVSELSTFPGIEYVGPLPPDLQEYTTFSSGIVKGAKQEEPARALVRFLKTPEAAAIFRTKGMEPG
jgi:molybdate transport system substrate-binding protein